MIVDASVLLCAFFPDEAQAHSLVREHVAGRIQLNAPSLLPYELSNAIWQAERRGRVSRSQADEILQAFIGLEIEIIPQAWGEMLPLAEARKESFIIADGRLYAAIHAHLDWVLWIRDYPCDAETE